MVVGWDVPGRMAADLAVSAPGMARRAGYVAGGAIFHSDRGSRYTSRLLADWARAADVRLSVGRTGSCRDNAVAESFFASLENEMYSLRGRATRSEARTAAYGYIERHCNRQRPHSSIGYEVPAERMAAFMQRCERAFAGPEETEEAVPLAA